MQKYSVFSALFLSFFSADFYRDVGRNWRGIGLKLLFFVLVFSWVLVGVRMHIGLADFAKNDFPRLAERVPPIRIQDGVASSPVPQPYEIREGDDGKVFAVIDTTGKIDSLDDTDADLLLTATRVYVRNENRGDIRIYDLKEAPNFSIDKAKLTGWMDRFAGMFAYIAVPAGIIISLIYRLLQGLIYAVIGLIWNNAFNANLSYAALMRLSFVAVTPVIVIDTALWMTGVNVPLWSLLCLVIAMVYLFIAVKANEQESPYLTDGPGGQNYFQPAPFATGGQPPANVPPPSPPDRA